MDPKSDNTPCIIKDEVRGMKNGIWQALPDNSRYIRILSCIGSVPSRSGQIQCCLETVALLDELASKPEYDALSYVWETQHCARRIICNNHAVGVTENLYAALARLWSQSPKRKIWADALCINQSDKEEKSAQISLMKQIYSSALSVIVWLGEEDQSASVAWPVIERAIPKFFLGISGASERFDDIAAALGYNEPVETETLSRHLTNLSRRSWFTRAWTYEEIALAREAIVYCGHFSMPWDHFSVACSRLALDVETMGWLSEGYRGMVNSRSQRHDLALLPLLLQIWHRDAYDARDKIFSVLGLVQKDRYPTLRANYNLSVKETYVQAARLIIDVDRDLSVLKLAGCGRQTKTSASLLNDKLPSWVPNWQSIYFDETFTSSTSLRNLNKTRYNRLISTVKIDPDVHLVNKNSTELTIRGFAIGRVESTLVEDSIDLVGFPTCAYGHDDIESFSIFDSVTDPNFVPTTADLSIFAKAVSSHSTTENPCATGVCMSNLIRIRLESDQLLKAAVHGDWLCVFRGERNVLFVLRPLSVQCEDVHSHQAACNRFVFQLVGISYIGEFGWDDVYDKVSPDDPWASYRCVGGFFTLV